MNHEALDRMSRVVVILYAVVAGLNVLSFVIGGHDLNKLGIAALLVVLIEGQKATDAWRETARVWQERAEERR
jgi:hypothetical protein